MDTREPGLHATYEGLSVSNKSESILRFTLREANLTSKYILKGAATTSLHGLKFPDSIRTLYTTSVDFKIEFFECSYTQQITGYDLDVALNDAEGGYNTLHQTEAMISKALCYVVNSQKCNSVSGNAPQQVAPLRLSDIAPAVFVPAYAETLTQRSKLVPTIGKILASYSSGFSQNRSTAQGDSTPSHRGALEEGLWLSLIHTLKLSSVDKSIPSRAVKVKRPTKENHGTPSAASNTRDDPTSIENATPRFVPLQARDAGDEFEWCSGSSQGGYSDAGLLDSDFEEGSDEDVSLLSFSAEYLAEADECPANAAARPSTSKCLKPMVGGSLASPANLELSLTEGTNKADNASLVLTKLDHNEKISQQIGQIPCMIGGDLLSHKLGSTIMQGSSPTEEEEADMLIMQDSVSSSGIGSPPQNNSDQLFCAHEGIPDTASQDLFERPHVWSGWSGAKRFAAAEMASQQLHTSLYGVLGPDHLMWSIWKKRGSTALPEGGDLLETHDIFENDPDMKLLQSPRDDEPVHNETMIFDDFDFSRNPSQSTTTSNSTSCFGQLEDNFREQEPPRSSSMPRDLISTPIKSTKHLLSSLTPKKCQSHDNREMTDDDILFQQSSPLRKADIKKWNSLLDYHKS